MLGVSPASPAALMAAGEEALPKPGQLRTLRTIGATGEPMSPGGLPLAGRDDRRAALPDHQHLGAPRSPRAFLGAAADPQLKLSSLGGPGLGMDSASSTTRATRSPPRVGQLICRASWPAMTMGCEGPGPLLETYCGCCRGLVHGDWAKRRRRRPWFLHGRSDGHAQHRRAADRPDRDRGGADRRRRRRRRAAIPVPHEIKARSCGASWSDRGGRARRRRARRRGSRPSRQAFKPSRIVFVETLPRTKTARPCAASCARWAGQGSPAIFDALLRPRARGPVARGVAEIAGASLAQRHRAHDAAQGLAGFGPRQGPRRRRSGRA